jgi:hypothetical protein
MDHIHEPGPSPKLSVWTTIDGGKTFAHKIEPDSKIVSEWAAGSIGCPPTPKMGMTVTLAMGTGKRTCPAENPSADARVVAVVLTMMTPPSV